MINEQVISHGPVKLNTGSGKTKKGQHCAIHFHTELEFLYMRRGCMKCCTDDAEYYIREGDVAFINSKVPHFTEVMEDGTYDTLLQFRDPSGVTGAMHYLSKFLRNSDIPCYVFDKDDPDTAELKKYIDEMVREDKERKNGYSYYITANMHMITALLHRRDFLPEESKLLAHKAIEKIMPVVEYIDENYSEHITLKELSRVMNLNEYYFCRMFKKATGATVTDYLNFVRVSKAEKMLKSGMSISEVSYNVGFSSLSYFNRIFKKYKFCSPSSYKQISNHIDRFVYED
ncbi:MAG: helix-turn-helix domain-containing protein [Clostridia bacterium]|nr:helix-turn-helix domain-containing protein [Clostridia bacterium]